jgi:hypothetical protein
MHNERRRRQRPGHGDQLPAKHNERRRGERPGVSTKYLRCTTSGAVGNGLCTTIKYLRGATGIGLGTTIKYLRRATIVAANNGLGTTIKYIVNQNAGAGRNLTKAHIHKSWARIQMNPPAL